VRHALAALGYQETINFSFVEERWERELSGNEDPIKVLNPIAARWRDALEPDGQPGQRAQVQPGAPGLARARVRGGPRVLARRQRGLHRHQRRRCLPAHACGGLAYGQALPLQWGEAERNVDFFDVKGDVERCWPYKASFQAAEHPAMHPGRCAAVLLDGEVIGHVGELHPKWRQAYDLPQAPVLFELNCPPCRPAPCRSPSRCRASRAACATWPWWSPTRSATKP
jgi:phenylalanyl-tRNA synthetase beta chain